MQLQRSFTNQFIKNFKFALMWQWLEEHEPEVFLTAEEGRNLGRGHKGVPCECVGGCKKLWCPLDEADRAAKPLKIVSISHGACARALWPLRARGSLLP